MALRSALQQSWYVTIPVLAFLGWLLLSLSRVVDLLGAVTEGALAGESLVGTAFVSGVAGLVVMGVVALVFLLLYSELGEATPGPSPWPPDE